MRPHHPATATLVEVAPSSLARDLHEKPHVHAAAGRSANWVVDLDKRRAYTHHRPRRGTYEHIDELEEDGDRDLAAVGLPAAPLRDLFAAADR